MVLAEAPERTNIELFRQGQLSDYRVTKSTISLNEFLRQNGYRVEASSFQGLYTALVETHPEAIIQLAYLDRGRQCFSYRVEPDLVETLIPTLQEVIPSRKPRSVQEQIQARDRLLRLYPPGRHTEYQQISLEEAYRRLRAEGLTQTRLRWFSRDVAEELIDGLMEKLQPYLLGEVGSFDNFTKFRNFFNRAAVRKAIDYLRSAQRREISTEPQSIESTSDPNIDGEYEEEIEQGDQLLLELAKKHNLTANEVSLLQKRRQGLSYAEIAVSDPQNRATAALKTTVSRIKKAIHEGRRRHIKVGLKPIPDKDLLAEYSRFRTHFLAQNGGLPNVNDLNQAKQRGDTRFSRYPYIRAFSPDGSWGSARSTLERLLLEQSS